MNKGMSIHTKAALSTIVFMGILTAAIAVIGYKLYYDSVMESYTAYAETVLEYAYRAAGSLTTILQIRCEPLPDKRARAVVVL